VEVIMVTDQLRDAYDVVVVSTGLASPPHRSSDPPTRRKGSGAPRIWHRRPAWRPPSFPPPMVANG